MKKLLIPILLVAALTSNKVEAAPTTYYVDAINGTGTGCTQAIPCKTSTDAFKLVTDSDTIVVGFGYITSTGPTANFLSGSMFVNSNFPARADTSKYVTFVSSAMHYTGDPGDIQFSTSSTIIVGEQINIHNFDHLIIKGMYVKDTGRAFSITDSSYVKVMASGIKNGADGWSDDHPIAFSIASQNNNDISEVGCHHILVEDVWSVGTGRYQFIAGGTDPLVSSVTFRRVVTRSDGTGSNQPVAGLTVYGAASGGIDGTQDTLIQNSIAIDFNNDGATFYPGTENVYSGMYLAHGPTRHENFESISIGHGTNWSGYGFGEDSVSKVAFYDCVSWDVGGQGFIGNATGGSSVTLRGCTIGRTRHTANEAIALYNSWSQVAFDSCLLHRNRNAMQNTSNDFFGFHLSSENVANSTNEIVTTPTPSFNIYVASRTETVYVAAGKNGRNVGASIRWKRGTDGTYNDEAGARTLRVGESLWPFPYENRIKSLFARPDEGNSATNNSSNNEQRGFANLSSTKTLSAYIWEYDGAVVPDFVVSAAGDPCLGTTLSPSISNVTSSSLDTSWTSVGGSANYVKVFDDNSDFSSPVSSVTETTASKSYSGLSSSTQYFFQVKLSTEGDCAYSGTNGTTSAAPATGTPQKLQFNGTMTIRGVNFQ